MNIVVKQGIVMGLVAGVTAPAAGLLMMYGMTEFSRWRSQAVYHRIVYEEDTIAPVARRVVTMGEAVKEAQRMCQEEKNWECNAQAIMVGEFESTLANACARTSKKSKVCKDLERMRTRYVGWVNARVPRGK